MIAGELLVVGEAVLAAAFDLEEPPDLDLQEAGVVGEQLGRAL